MENVKSYLYKVDARLCMSPNLIHFDTESDYRQVHSTNNVPLLYTNNICINRIWMEFHLASVSRRGDVISIYNVNECELMKLIASSRSIGHLALQITIECTDA